MQRADVAPDDGGQVVNLSEERPKRLTPEQAEQERERLIRKVVHEYNQSHALARIKGRTYILTEEPDELGHPSYVLSGERDFLLYNRNQTVKLPKVQRARGQAPVVVWEKKQCAPLWLSHEERRSITRITFKPSGNVADYEYNVFHGWGVHPSEFDPEAPEKGCERILDLCRRLFGQDEESYHWAMAWLADTIQNPQDKPGTALVLRSKEGAGKGTLMNAVLGPILRNAYVHIGNRKHLTSNFNSILQGTLLFFVDEAFWAGDKEGEGALKYLITEPTLMIEGKGKDAFSMPNLARVVFASNESWVVPVGPHGRRFAVYDCDESMAQNVEYFAAIRDEAKNGGREAFLAYLMHLDTSGIDLRNPPLTGALIRQKVATLRGDSVAHWFFERLCDGEMFGGSDMLANGEWPREITRDRVRASYTAYCDRMKVRHPASGEDLGRFLIQKMGASSARQTKKDADGSRPMLYRFHAHGEELAADASAFRLAHFRGIFEKEHFGGPYDWPDSETDTVDVEPTRFNGHEDDDIPF